MAPQADYKNFEAVTLFCPRCQQANPVRKRLLLVLPDGEKYEYLCARCNHPVGDKVERGGQGSRLLIR